MGAQRGAVATVSGGLTVEIEEKRFGDRPVLGEVAFRLAPGERTALTGPSGIGKSTLIAILAGLDRDFAGRVTRPEGRVAVVFQKTGWT